MSSFGDRIREERARIGLSMQQMADHCEITLRSQGNYERGERDPGREYLERLDVLGVDLLYVVTGRRAGGANADAPQGVESLMLKDWRALDVSGQKAVLQMIAALKSASEKDL